jgi:hypothetical protein
MVTSSAKPEVLARWGAQLTSGRALGSYCLTEPDAGDVVPRLRAHLLAGVVITNDDVCSEPGSRQEVVHGLVVDLEAAHSHAPLYGVGGRCAAKVAAGRQKVRWWWRRWDITAQVYRDDQVCMKGVADGALMKTYEKLERTRV